MYPLLLKGIHKRVAERTTADWLKRMNITEFANQRASFLSGGEKQKMAIARAMVLEPELLLLDEPTANLDGKTTREIEALLKELVSEGTRVIMATHDLSQVKRIATDVVFLHRGQLVEKQLVRDFFENPDSEKTKAFLRGDILE